MGFVSDDESPNRIPATVPYTAAFIESPPEPPKASSRTESSESRPIVIAHWRLDAFSFPRQGRRSRRKAEPGDDHDGADHLATAHVLLREQVAERQGEHDGRDEQRLDHREASAVERAGLEQVPRDQRRSPEQPLV